jgi:hypothetical protein
LRNKARSLHRRMRNAGSKPCLKYSIGKDGKETGLIGLMPALFTGKKERNNGFHHSGVKYVIVGFVNTVCGVGLMILLLDELKCLLYSGMK